MGVGVTLTANYSSQYLLLPFFLSLDLKGGDDAELRTKYAEKGARCTYQAIYFTISTIWGYAVLKDTNWLPWWMGGPNDGDAENIYKNLPYTPCPTAVLNYSLYTTGYHVGVFFKHIYENRENNDFYEMLLHHIIATTLTCGAFLANIVPGSTAVAWVHDIS